MPSLVHKDVGPSLTFAEYHDQAAHTISGGVAGDMLFFDGTSLVRLPKGAEDQVLATKFGIPTWIPAPGGGGTSSSIVAQSSTAFTVARANPNYAFQVDTNDAGSANGIRLAAHPAGLGVTLNVISTAADDSLKIDAKGAGGINIGSDSTGNIILGSITVIETNLGFRVAPHTAWIPAWNVIDFNMGIVAIGTNGGNAYYMQNSYFDGTDWRNTATGATTQMAQSSAGEFAWFADTSPGPANTIFTPTLRMFLNTTALNVNSNLSVGANLTVGDSVSIGGSTDANGTVNVNNGDVIINNGNFRVESGLITYLITSEGSTVLAHDTGGTIDSEYKLIAGHNNTAFVNNAFAWVDMLTGRYVWWSDPNDVMHFPQGFSSEAASNITGNLVVTGSITGGSYTGLPVPSLNLDALTDVIISTPATNQLLTYNGTNWVNLAPAASVWVPTATSNLNMANFLILNIGDAGTDFTAGGGLNLAGGLNFTNVIAGGSGGVYKSASGGLNIQALAGSTNDFVLSNPATTIIMRIPTGSANVIMPAGNVSITGGNLTVSGSVTAGSYIGLPANLITNPMTTAGDLIIGGASGTPTRLGIGSNTQVLTLTGGVPVWATPASGGMTNPMTAVGDIIIGGASGAATRLAAGTNTHVLTLVSGSPAWAAPAAPSLNLDALTDVIISTPANTQLLTYNGTNWVNAAPTGITQAAADILYVNVSGDTMTGTLTVNGGAVNVGGAAGTFRSTNYYTGVNQRWGLLINNTSESGSNAGSDLIINRFNDAGSYLGTSLSIVRSTGVINFETTPSWSGSPAINQADGDTRYVNVSGDTMTGALSVATSMQITATIAPPGTQGTIFAASGAGLSIQGFTGTNNDFTVFNAANSAAFGVPVGTQNLRVYKHVGIGTAPLTLWGSTWTAFDIQSGLAAFTVDTTGGNVHLSKNAYNDGTNWRNSSNAAAGLFTISSSQSFIWYSVPSPGGTGTIITFVEKMRLNANAQLGLNGAPNAGWGSTMTVYDLFGSKGSFSSDSSGYIQIAQNLYNDGTNWRNVANAPVSMFSLLVNGTIGFYASASPGAAGSVYTPSQKMLIDSGSVYIDVTLNHRGTTLGFYNTTPATKPTVSGAKGSNAALGSLCTALATLGLINNTTTA